MSSDTILKNLETIINKNLDNIDIPLKHGKSIYIKNYSVSQQSNGTFVVINTHANKQIATTEFKVSAIAIARDCAKGRNNVKEILSLDKDLSKHYNDALFYKNAIKNAKTSEVVEIKTIRLDQSVAMSKKIRKSLNYFIFRH